MKENKVDIKDIVKLENRDYGELNDMANSIIDESLFSLLNMHINGSKREQLSAFTALVKKYPEYKIFCYPETFLRENELYICKENCDFVRRSAFYDMVSNYEDVQEFCDIEPVDIDTGLIFIDWQDEKMKQPSKEEIEAIRENFVNFIDYMNRLKVEIASNKDVELYDYHNIYNDDEYNDDDNN
ncbi:MAG: hypothetical protein ACI4TX_03330 [Christensenellales bacterium]